MIIHNVVIILDEQDTFTSIAFPCSSQERAEEIEQEAEEIYGQTMIACAIVPTQIDAGFDKPKIIH